MFQLLDHTFVYAPGSSIVTSYFNLLKSGRDMRSIRCSSPVGCLMLAPWVGNHTFVGGLAQKLCMSAPQMRIESVSAHQNWKEPQEAQDAQKRSISFVRLVPLVVP